jgi:hypothetical protein
MREAMLFNQLIFKGPISGAASNKSSLVLVCFAFPVLLTFAAKGKGPVNEVDYLGTILARDQEKWKPVFRPIMLQNISDDHVYHFRPIRPEVIVI